MCTNNKDLFIFSKRTHTQVPRVGTREKDRQAKIDVTEREAGGNKRKFTTFGLHSKDLRTRIDSIRKSKRCVSIGGANI